MKKMKKAMYAAILAILIFMVQMPVPVKASTTYNNVKTLNYTMVVGETGTFQLSASVPPGKINGSL